MKAKIKSQRQQEREKLAKKQARHLAYIRKQLKNPDSMQSRMEQCRMYPSPEYVPRRGNVPRAILLDHIDMSAVVQKQAPLVNPHAANAEAIVAAERRTITSKLKFVGIDIPFFSITTTASH